MKKLIFLAAMLTSSISMAQTIPTLAKEWTGTITVSSIGAPIKHHPGHESHVGKDKSPQGVNFFSEPRTLTVVKQEGRHVEFIHKSARFSNTEVGVISADGKKVIISAKGYSVLMEINGDQFSGCGTTRGNDGTFDHFHNALASFCYEFKAVK